MDTETTGLDPRAGHTLIEIAALPVLDGKIGEVWSTLVQPGRGIPPDATAVHGITDAMVASAPAAATVAAELVGRCADSMLVFHNAAFDLPFLSRLLASGGAPPLLHPVLDTLGLARGLPGAGGHSLGEMADRYGLAEGRPHRAAPDALTTARLLLALAPRWERERGVRSLDELAAISQDVLRRERARPVAV